MRLFGSSDGKSPKVNLQTALRDSLITSFVDNRLTEFAELCSSNAELVHSCYDSWRQVPEQIRGDINQANSYVADMIEVARYFEQKGDCRHAASLSGPRKTNPIEKWGAKFSDSKALMARGRYEEAIASLKALASEIDRHRVGNARVIFLPMMYGAIGEGYFKLGRHVEALKATSEALAGCQKAGDIEGTICYCGNLAEIHKATGDGAKFRYWIITTTNILIQVGRLDDARAVRRKNGILPLDTLIEVKDGLTDVN